MTSASIDRTLLPKQIRKLNFKARELRIRYVFFTFLAIKILFDAGYMVIIASNIQQGDNPLSNQTILHNTGIISISLLALALTENIVVFSILIYNLKRYHNLEFRNNSRNLLIYFILISIVMLITLVQECFPNI